jgi:putative transposase
MRWASMSLSDKTVQNTSMHDIFVHPVQSKNANTALSQGLHASPHLLFGVCTQPPLPHTQPSLRGEQGEGARRMDWQTWLADIPGTVDQAYLVRHAYLVTENRRLRSHIKGRIRRSDGERTTLAAIGQKLGKQALQDVATIGKPDTMLGWHRTRVAQQCDGSPQRKAPGRPRITPVLEALIVRMAQEHRAWASDRMVGALASLGVTVSDQTVGNVLKRHGLALTPERKTTTTWKACIRTPMEVRVATDCFTAEVWTRGGRVTYDVLFLLRLSTREGHVAGVTPHPNEAWRVYMARHVTMEAWGFLPPGQSVIHARDGQYCPAFPKILDTAGGTRGARACHSPRGRRISTPPRRAGYAPSRRHVSHG